MGALDKPFRTAASAIIKAVVTNQSTLTRTLLQYDASSGEAYSEAITQQVRVAPPSVFSLGDIAASGDSGSPLQAGDFQGIIAAKDLSTISVPDAETDELTRPDGTVYQIIHVEPVESGDEVAIYILTCRK